MPITRKRIIDNKYLEMTDDEFHEYEKICSAATTATMKGEELFRDRFVSDDDGRIIYLKALGNRHINFETMFFLANLMQNQHLRAMYAMVDAKLKQVDEIIKTLSSKK